jgi:hypothetical protein
MNRRSFLSLTAASLAAMSLKVSGHEASSEPTVGVSSCLAANMLFEPSSTCYAVDPRAIPYTILLNDEGRFWKNVEKQVGVRSDWGGFPTAKLIFWRGELPGFAGFPVPVHERYQSGILLNHETCRELSDPRNPKHVRKAIRPKPFTLDEFRKNQYPHVMLNWITPPNNSKDELDIMLVTLLDLASHTSEQHMPPSPVWGTRKQSQSLVSRMHDADYYLSFRKGYPRDRQLLTHPDNLQAFVDARLRQLELTGPTSRPTNWVYASKACPKNVAYLTAPKEWLGPFQQNQNGQIIMAVLNDTAVTKIEL